MSAQHDPQQRWEELVERELGGETLTEAERAFMRAHEAAVPAAAREGELWQQIFDELAAARAEAFAVRAVAAHRAEVAAASPSAPSELPQSDPPPPERPQPRPARRRVAAGVGLGLALASAAGLALWFGVEATAPSGAEVEATATTPSGDRIRSSDARSSESSAAGEFAPSDPVLAVTPAAVLSLRSDDGHDGPALGSLVEPGAALSLDAPTCLTWTEPTGVVCFEGGVSLPATEPHTRRIRLSEGRLVAALDPLAPGQRFVVETMHGTVSAIGTVFAVETHEGRIWVTVLEGEVELDDGERRRLRAGSRASLRGEIPGDEPEPTPAVPTALTQLANLATTARAAPEIRTQLPPTPVELEPEPTPRPERQTESSPAPVPSAKQLAAQAQRERAAGRHAETARLYRALLDHYPDSPEAVSVPVRLGDLLLSTGDHAGALAAYELYLARGARQLTPEAEYGRIEALEGLGRDEELRRAIVEFLAAHPDDFRSPGLRGRL